MRILVDASAARFGGIRMYAEALFEAWHRRYPQDQLVIAGPADLQPRIPYNLQLRTSLRSSLSDQLRLYGMLLPRALRVEKPDAYLALHPALPLGPLPSRRMVVSHDLRHVLRPTEFTRRKRLERTFSYRHAHWRASTILAVSERTRRDLIVQRWASPEKVAVAYHGVDHVSGWQVGSMSPHPVAPFALTFGHHTNKNIDLLIQSWQAAPTALRLVVTGLDPADIARRNKTLPERVSLLPYVSDVDFRSLMLRAAVVIMASSFEGFGLPALEGLMLRKRVVVAPDPALVEITRGHAVVMSAWTTDALHLAVSEAQQLDAQALERGHDYAKGYTWSRTAERTRDVLLRGESSLGDAWGCAGK
jgi:glycosyltransferase involved in cell wall biosynthesis